MLTAAGKADAWWATLAMMEARGTINRLKWKIHENPMNMDDLGYPYFRKLPYDFTYIIYIIL